MATPQYQNANGDYTLDGKQYHTDDFYDAGGQIANQSNYNDYQNSLANYGNRLNGNTAIQGINSQGYSRGAYDPATIADAHRFGMAFQPGKYGAAVDGDYSNANASLAQAAQYGQLGNDQSYQNAALQQAYATANGAPTAATQLGYQTLNNGMAAQQAAAGSAMGGSLGQAAALRQNAQGAAGMQAQGVSAIQANQATAQDAARQQYAQQVAAMRSSNQQGMQSAGSLAGAYGTNAQNRASFAQGQRGLADQASLYGQGLAQNEKASNYQQQQNEANMAQQGGFAKSQDQRDQDAEETKRIGAGISAGTSFLGSMFKMASDVRAKEPASLASAAEMRYWR